jgi:hypothetical protein
MGGLEQKSKLQNLDVRNVFAGSHTEHPPLEMVLVVQGTFSYKRKLSF